MTALENLKNKIIDRVLTSKNKKLLEAIDGILESMQPEDNLSLSSEQVEMLAMAEENIEKGNIVSESKLREKYKKRTSAKTLKYIIYKEEKYYVSQCLNVDVSSFGNTPEEALKNLHEALELYFEDKEALNNLTYIEEAHIGETKINV